MHVVRYLRDVMPIREADAFVAERYHWSLRRVRLTDIQLLRTVDIRPGTVRRYRELLDAGTRFPALVGLAGDGEDVTKGVLLCDGYHRACAMRDNGLRFVWMWLAAGVRADEPAEMRAADSRSAMSAPAG